MGKFFIELDPRTQYVCYNCFIERDSNSQDIPIVRREDIIANGYRTQFGTGILVKNTINSISDKTTTKIENYTSGDYEICDVLCKVCLNLLGWKYLTSLSEHNLHKEGCYLLSLSRLKRVNIVSFSENGFRRTGGGILRGSRLVQREIDRFLQSLENSSESES